MKTKMNELFPPIYERREGDTIGDEARSLAVRAVEWEWDAAECIREGVQPKGAAKCRRWSPKGLLGSGRA